MWLRYYRRQTVLRHRHVLSAKFGAFLQTTQYPVHGTRIHPTSPGMYRVDILEHLVFKISLCRRQGPLRTRAKSRDHEIVRTQKKWPKAVPKTWNVVTGPQVKCEDICDRALTQMLFQWVESIYLGSFCMIIYNKSTVVRFWSPWSPGFCVKPTSKRYTKYDNSCRMVYNATMIMFRMTLVMNVLNKYCHGWWMSSSIGQNPTFSC